MTVVHRPAAEHSCDVGWSEREFELPPPPLPGGWPLGTPPKPRRVVILGQYDPVGTVRRCEECGQTWVARRFRQPYSNLYINQRIEWHRESRLARWWRGRRAG